MTIVLTIFIDEVTANTATFTNMRIAISTVLIIVRTRSSAIAERPRCTLFKLWLNISAKSVHLTVLYVTALTWTNHYFTVLRHHVGT